MKGEADLVDGHVKGVGIGVSCQGVRCLRVRDGENAGEQYAEESGAFAPMTGHGEQV